MNQTDMRDVWVRQILGNQGEVSAADARDAMKTIVRNVESGLLPTTSGAVSLMFSDHVDVLYRNNRGPFAKFRPRVPDNRDRPAKSLADWYIAAIEQALFYGLSPHGQRGRPFRESLTLGMDGVLQTYENRRIDWVRVHAYATSLDRTVQPYLQGEWWLSDGSGPLSVLALCGAATRAAAALYE